MYATDIKKYLRLQYYLRIGSKSAETEKKNLRQALSTMPLSSDFPFDVEAKLLRSLNVRPSMLDIGSNTGFYSAIMEDIIGPENLYLFEPLPHLNKFLRRRFKGSKVLNLALSDRQGTELITMPYINGQRLDTRASLNCHTEEGQTGSRQIEVKLRRLDDVAEDVGWSQIGFIKIDVEGHELEVINGGLETIRQFKPLILVEIELRHHPFSITEVFSRIEAMDYRGFILDPENFRVLKTSEFNPQVHQNQNYLASKQLGRYLNNFFFVHKSSEDDFLGKVEFFMDQERQSAKNLA